MKLSGAVAFIMVLQQALAQVTVLVNDFPVSDVTGKSVYRPALAVAPNSSFAVTWGDSRLGTQNRSGGEGDIYACLIGMSGTSLTPNFKVDNISMGAVYADFSIFFSSPVFLPSGQLVVVWHVHGVSAVYGIQSYDVYYTLFSSTGLRLGSDVQLNRLHNLGSGYATRPNVVFVPPSTFLAVFEYSESGNSIDGTLVDANSGNLIGETFVISDNAFQNRIYPHAASNGSSTVVVWTDGRTDTQTGDIYMQRIVGSNFAGANVRVNDDPQGGYNQYGRVAMDAQGNFVVVWIDTRASSSGDLFAQRFNAQGTRIGTNFKLTKSNSELWEYPPGIAMKSDGSFVVTWADSVKQIGKDWGVKTRFFGSAGQPLSDVIEVTGAPSLEPDVRIGPAGAIYYTWLDGRENIVLGRIYSKIYAGFPTTGVEDRDIAVSFRLEQNYPNPFNPSTTIDFHLSASSVVTLKVSDILGREIATLVNEERQPGTHSVRWDASSLPSGMYLYCVRAGEHVQRMKMTLLK